MEQVLQKLEKYYAEKKRNKNKEMGECWAAEANTLKINEIHEEKEKVKVDTW